jgi:hypothetical protein
LVTVTSTLRSIPPEADGVVAVIVIFWPELVSSPSTTSAVVAIPWVVVKITELGMKSPTAGSTVNVTGLWLMPSPCALLTMAVKLIVASSFPI